MSLIVRDLDPADEARWRELWAGYCVFYKATVAPEVTDVTWARLMSEASPIFGMVAELDGKVVAIVNGVVHENTWSQHPVCYLEDLFTAENARGQGAATALIQGVVARARDEGWRRVYWMTKSDNKTARTLYDKLTPSTDWVRYDIDL